MTLQRRWLVVLVVGWGVLLLVLGIVAGYAGDGSVAEQSDVAEAQPAVDAAAVDLVNTVGNDAAVRVWPYQKLSTCRISLVRDGVEYHRRVELFVRPGDERDLITELARRLPASYEARTSPDDGAVRLTGHGDGFVRMTGSAKRRGVVSVELRTGCRPEAAPRTERPSPSRSERMRLNDVLGLTGASDRGAQWRTDVVTCGTEAVRTVRLTVANVPDRPLKDGADLVPPDARVLLASTKVLAYRQGAVSVVAEVRGDQLRLTSTSTAC